MAVSTLALYACWRDYGGMYNPRIEPYHAPLEESRCHAPRFVLIPDVQNQVIPLSGKIEYNFFLVPGSIIHSFWVMQSGASGNSTDGTFAIQLTDIGLEHQFFQEPADTTFLATQGAQQDRLPSYMLLPTPHPVVGDSLFSLEVWGTPGDTFRMILGCGEVTDCPVR